MADTKILIVENKKSVAEDLERPLKHLKYTVCAVVPTGAQAVEKAAEMQPDVVLIDIELEGEICTANVNLGHKSSKLRQVLLLKFHRRQIA